ncbi:MAG: arylsulfatase [Lacunisphaera sp.]|nr:arylsulfatase [Lacunisphaera sp.]
MILSSKTSPLVALVALALPWMMSAEPSVGRPPNIVLILADDMGWSDLGCYGGEIPTPNLDQLARDGLRFTQFYNNSVCGPSRASLLTGLYAQRIGHTGRHWNQPTDYTRCLTFGEALQRAGYHTMMVGKWQDPDLAVRRGFDRHFGPMTHGIISYYDEVQANPFYLDDHRVSLPEDFYLTDALTDYALDFLREAATQPKGERKPFLLYFAHIAPHWPLHARESEIAPHRARYQAHGWDDWRKRRFERQQALGLLPAGWSLSPRLPDLPAWEDAPARAWQAERMAVYAAQIASIDRSAGRLLAALDAMGERENTLVIFLSDNGAAHDGGMHPADAMFGFAQGAAFNHTWRLNGRPVRPGSGPDNLPGPADTFFSYGPAWAMVSDTPFRDLKLTGYEGGIRTPLIARWPAVITRHGALTDEVGHVIDLLPTFLDLAGASYPTELGGRHPLPPDGRSLAPVFRGTGRPPPEFLAWRVPRHRALRMGDWKIVGADDDGPWQLFNLAADGTETTDVAAQYPRVVARLAARWQQWKVDTSAQP